jgi:hypothetical protein
VRPVVESTYHVAVTPLLVAVALLAAGLLSTALYTTLIFAFAPFARVFPHRVVFGFGPRLWKGRVGATDVEIALLPNGSTISLYGSNPYESPEEAAALAERMPAGRLFWTEAPVWRRVFAFVIAPRAAWIVAASIVLGPTRAVRSAGVGITELLAGALSPLSAAPAAWQRGAGILTTEGLLALTAVALCKLSSFSVLSLPGDLAFAATRGRGTGLAKVRVIAMLAMLLIWAVWMVGWVVWAAR